jgi:hypothetical protein
MSRYIRQPTWRVLVAVVATAGASYLTLTVAAGNRADALLGILAVTWVAAGWSLSRGVSPAPYAASEDSRPQPPMPATSAPRAGAILLVLGLGLAAVAIPSFYLQWKTLLPLWATACGLAFFGAAWLGSLGRAAQRPQPAPAVRVSHLALFALCLLIATFFRVYRIHDMPPGLFVDEANISLDALHILDGRPDSPFSVGWYETPSLYAYYLAGLIKLGGAHLFTLKAASVIPGILAVAAVYPLAQLLFGSRAALIATFLLAVSRWHLSFSRWGWNALMPPLFQLAATALLLYAFATRRLLHFFLAGFILGLGMYTYLASRLVVATIVAYLAFRIVLERGFFQREKRGLALFGLGYALCFGPLAMTYAHSSFAFLNRTQQVSVFNDVAAAGNWSPAIHNIANHLLMFHGVGDANPRHNVHSHPMLCPAAGTLLLLGCGLALWRWSDHRFALLLLWMIIALQGGILSSAREAPQAYRTLGVVPAICLLAGATADAWVRVVGQVRTLRPLAWFALLSALAFNAYNSYQQYFIEQAGDPRLTLNFSPAENQVAQRVLREREQRRDISHVYLSPRLYGFSPLHFLTYEPPQSGRGGIANPLFQVMEPQADLPLPENGDRDVLLLLDPQVGETLPIVQAMYPHLHATPISYDGQALYTEVAIPQQDLIAVRHLTAVDADGKPLAQTAPRDQSLRARIAALAPGEALVGAFKAPSSGIYEFENDPSVVIAIDGTIPASAVQLGQGLHDIRLTRTEKPGAGAILLRMPGVEESQPLDSGMLFRVSSPHEGLRGRYYAGSEWKGDPLFERIDPIIAFTWPGDEPTQGPFSVRWSGKLRVPRDGDYVLLLQCDDGCALDVDRDRVLGAFAQGSRTLQTTASLRAGLHDVQVYYMQLGGSKSIRFSWRPPDGTLGLVPPNSLIPDPPANPMGRGDG